MNEKMSIYKRSHFSLPLFRWLTILYILERMHFANYTYNMR